MVPPASSSPKTMDWDNINAAAVRAYKHAIVKRERLARITGR